MKENWRAIGISLKLDHNIIRLMKDTKDKFDKVNRNKNLSDVKKDEFVNSMKETTMNLAASNWMSEVNQDRSLNAAWRQEKIAFVEDFIGKKASR